MEENKKTNQKQKKNRLNQSSKTTEKDAAVKSEKLRYKNADSIYDI